MATFKTTDVERVKPDEEFTVECVKSGNSYVIPHPKSVSAHELINMNINDPAQAFGALLGEEFYDFMHEGELDGFALEAILEAWMVHYDIAVSPGNGRSSRRPSTTTPKRSKPTSPTKGGR